MNEPRPSITSARPLERASTVEKRWKTRMGSSELRTVTAEPSRMLLGPGGGGGQEHLRGGHCEVAAVVLPHAEGVKSDGVGQLRLVQQLPQHLGVRLGCRRDVHADVAERVQAEQDLAGTHGSGGSTVAVGSPAGAAVWPGAGSGIRIP